MKFLDQAKIRIRAGNGGSGPPNSTNFSLRKEAQPGPPLPDDTVISTRSINIFFLGFGTQLSQKRVF